MVGIVTGSSGASGRPRRRMRRAISPWRLERICDALARGRSEEAVRLILAEATRLARAPFPAAIYRASDGVLWAPGGQGMPAVLPGEIVGALRGAAARGAAPERLLVVAPGGQAVPWALVPAARAGSPAAILVVALPGGLLTCAQRRGLQLLAGLLPAALPQPSTPPEEDEALKRVVAGVAHELNNPLAIISGYAQVLLSGGATAELRPDLERIDRAARRVAQVVRDLLAFAREQPIAATAVPVEDLVRDALASEQAALAASGIGLLVEVSPGVPPVRGDRLQLTRVLVHLITYARRAIVGHPGASRLTIRAGGTDHVHLSLSDDGPGIAPELLDRLFEPFLTPQEGGLGLAVCRSIVRAHGGRIWATNNPAGGSTFHIELPAVL